MNSDRFVALNIQNQYIENDTGFNWRLLDPNYPSPEHLYWTGASQGHETTHVRGDFQQFEQKMQQATFVIANENNAETLPHSTSAQTYKPARHPNSSSGLHFADLPSAMVNIQPQPWQSPKLDATIPSSNLERQCCDLKLVNAINNIENVCDSKELTFKTR